MSSKAKPEWWQDPSLWEPCAPPSKAWNPLTLAAASPPNSWLDERFEALAARYFAALATTQELKERQTVLQAVHQREAAAARKSVQEKAALAKETAELRDAALAREVALTRLEGRVRELERDKRGLLQSLRRLQSPEGKCARMLKKLARGMVQLEEAHGETTRILEQRSRRLERTERERDALAKQNAALVERIQSLGARLEEAEIVATDAAMSASQQKVALLSDRARAEGTLKMKEALCAKLEKALAEATEARRDAEAAVLRERDAAEAEREEVHTICEEQRRKMSSLTARNSSMRDCAEDLAKELAEAGARCKEERRLRMLERYYLRDEARPTEALFDIQRVDIRGRGLGAQTGRH